MRYISFLDVTQSLNAHTYLYLFVLLLVELSAYTWVGAHFWFTLVIPKATKRDTEQRAMYAQVQRVIEQRFSIPALLVLFLANIGLLAGQTSLLSVFWLTSELSTVTALLLAMYKSFMKVQPLESNSILSFGNLILGPLILLNLAGLSYTSTPSGNITILLAGWVYILAATLAIGSIAFVEVFFIPMLQHVSTTARAQMMTFILAYFLPLAGTGILSMLLINILAVSLRYVSWEQLLTSVSGRALIFETLLLCGLLIQGIVISGIFRPHLHKELQKYLYIQQRYQRALMTIGLARSSKVLQQQEKQREARLTRKVHLIINATRWALIAAIGVVTCVGLMATFVSTTVASANVASPDATHTAMSPFVKTVATTDNIFYVTLTVTPNHFGANEFTVRVVDAKTGMASNTVHVSLALTMLDMNMGTQLLHLQTKGQGQFSGSGDFSMAGNWQIIISIRTSDALLHHARITLWTI